MNDPQVAALSNLTFGTPVEGGFFVGYITMPDGIYGIASAPKDSGELRGIWGKRNADVPGARSYFDCRANTLAMAEGGSNLAQKVIALDINGCTDWAIPSRDVLELLYRHGKPTKQAKNYVWRNGDNPSSLPVGYPYTEVSPTQTSCAAFQEGAAESLSPEWYWSSTQFSAGSAWIQSFYHGSQDSYDEDTEFLVRAVRRFKA